MSDDLHKQLVRVTERRKADREAFALKEKDKVRDQVSLLVKQKIMTATVGAIASFEKAYGPLMGLGLPYSELTESQKKFREVFGSCRDEIFTNGNTQVKKAEKDLSNFEFSLLPNRS